MIGQLNLIRLTQALCVIANIANGSTAKEFVMRDESLLKRLMQYMMNDSVKLQMAATYCVSNLVWSTEEGAVERQQKLRDLGVQKLLQSLLTTSDVNLFERYLDFSGFLKILINIIDANKCSLYVVGNTSNVLSIFDYTARKKAFDIKSFLLTQTQVKGELTREKTSSRMREC